MTAYLSKESEIVRKTYDIAETFHKGQTRWGGQPYIIHPIAVMEAVSHLSDDYKIVALLHDVVEDTKCTIQHLVDLGYSERIVAAIHAITKSKDEGYHDYIERVCENELARTVKKADIRHNLQTLKKGSMRDKYQLAIAYIDLYISHEEMIEDARHNAIERDLLD